MICGIKGCICPKIEEAADCTVLCRFVRLSSRLLSF
jgi:hypothetical protein